MKIYGVPCKSLRAGRSCGVTLAASVLLIYYKIQIITYCASRLHQLICGLFSHLCCHGHSYCTSPMMHCASIVTNKIQKITILVGKYTHLISENHEMLLKQSDIQQPHTSDFNDARMLLAVVWPRIILAIMKRAFRPRREDTVSYEASGRNNKLCGDYHLCTVRSTFC